MFEEPRYVSTSFNFSFPRKPEIRRQSYQIEDIVKETLAKHYSQPQVLAVPDEVDPEIPRIVFESTHGFSQIVISQINMALNVRYSPDWQTEPSKIIPYILQRVPSLFSVMEMIDKEGPIFLGFSTKCMISSNLKDEELVDYVRNLFLSEKASKKESSLHDAVIKYTEILDDKYFSNITVSNFRTWDFKTPPKDIIPFPRESASFRGIDIACDFNDRYAFNESESYRSNVKEAEVIVNRNFESVASMIKFIVRGEA